MSKVLVLNAGLHGDNSNSNKLTQMYLELRAATKHQDEVTVKDLSSLALPHLSATEMSSWMVAPDDRSDEQQQLAMLSDELINELFEQDMIVVGMPMYNMGVPSTFKAYIDRISRAGKTFSYTENGPVGLVKNKKVVVLAARGGMYQGTPLDSQTAYLQSIFGLMGMTDIEFIYAEGLNMGEEIANSAWQQAKIKLEALA